MPTYPTITVGELRDDLAKFPDDTTLDFGGLKYMRPKPRSKTHIQVEFAQTVYLDEQGFVAVDNHDISQIS